jgi:glycine cleavage system H lipoate-binding protein
MVVMLVVLTFAVFIALDYFVLRKRHVLATDTSPATAGLSPLWATQEQVPAGVFLQPTFTWSRATASGNVLLGVHPMLLELVGEPLTLEFREPGEQVAKGDPLVRVTRGDRHLTVRSPVDGWVMKVNREAQGTTRWAGNGDTWLYRLEPTRVADEVASWFSGDGAAAWTRRQYELLRGYLHDAVADGHLGAVMADGGDLPTGILGDMDARVWAGLEDRFLAHDEATR